MGYRSELESLREENRDLARRVSSLEGRAHARAPRSGAPESRWTRALGGRVGCEVIAEFPGTLSDAKIAAAVERLESDVGVTGQLRRIGSRVDWASPATFEQTRNVTVLLEERDGILALRVKERVARLGVGVYGLFLFWIIPLVSLWVALVVERLVAKSPHDAPGIFDIAVASFLVVGAAVTARTCHQLWIGARERRIAKLASTLTEVLAEAEPAARRARVEPRVIHDEFAGDEAAEEETALVQPRGTVRG